MSTTHPDSRPLSERPGGRVLCPGCRLSIEGHALTCPRCGETLPPPGAVWREGRTLVALRDGVLPECCVRCGDPGDARPIRRSLNWHHPAIYILVLWLIPYIVVALAVRKTTTLTMSVCERHRRIRRWSLWGGWGLFLASVACGAAAIALESAILGWLCLPLIVAAPVLGMGGRRLVTATRIDERLIRTRGAGRAFMDQIAEWNATEGGPLPITGSTPTLPAPATASVGHILAEAWPELRDDDARTAEYEWALEGLGVGVIATVVGSFASERRPLPTPAILRMAVLARARVEVSPGPALSRPRATWAPAPEPPRVTSRARAAVPMAVCGLAALIAIGASAMTWAHIHGPFRVDAYSGADVDGGNLLACAGVVGLIVCIVGGVLVFRRGSARGVGLCFAIAAAAHAFGLVGCALAFGDINQARTLMSEELPPGEFATVGVSVGAGLWEALVVSTIGLVAGVLGYLAMRRRQEEE